MRRILSGNPELIWFFYFLVDAHPPKYRQDGTESPEKNAGKTGTILSEDYAEIVDEEGDYSTPASKFIIIINT